VSTGRGKDAHDASLAFFYGGGCPQKNILSVLMHVPDDTVRGQASSGLAVGYSLSFQPRSCQG